MRKSVYTTCAICALAACSIRANTIPTPPVEARLTVSNETPYLKETFSITLEIVSRDVEVSSRLDLANLPDREILSTLGSFEALSVQRERENNQEITRRRYRAKVRAMQPGEISLAPVVRLTSRERVRNFFGSRVQEQTFSLQVPEVIIQAKELPSPPDGFTGIIGDFDINIRAEPLDIREGDLVTIETQLEGEGWIPENAIPSVDAATHLRAYRVREIASERSRKTFRQVVVPMDQSIKEIPAIPFIWFNPDKGEYETTSFGPFALQYAAAEDEPPAATTDPASDDQDLSSRRGLLRNRMEINNPTQAYVAPAATSRSTFTIPPGSEVRIMQKRENWVLIDYENNRGWIPTHGLSP